MSSTLTQPQDRVRSIAALTLATPRFTPTAAALGMKAAAAPSAGAATASVDAGSLVAFTAGVSADHTSAALNSALLAQLSADKLYVRTDNSQLMNWYAQYTKVLSLCGWTAQNFGFQNYQASGSTFSINNAIIEIIAAAASGPEVAVAEAALNALKNLSSDNPWFKVWDSTTRSANGGDLQIATAVDQNGARNTLAMHVSAFAYVTSATSTEVLWTQYTSSQVQLQYSTVSVTLDEDIWDQVSAAVITKLGDNANTQIGNLSI